MQNPIKIDVTTKMKTTTPSTLSLAMVVFAAAAMSAPSATALAFGPPSLSSSLSSSSSSSWSLSGLYMSSTALEQEASASTTTKTTTTLSDAQVSRGERQKMYGETLDLPDTYVRCGRCSAVYAITPDDLGTRGKGRRVECSVCSHSWFQSRDRLYNLNDGYELVDLSQSHLDRIAKNIEDGRPPDFVGVAKFYVGNLDYDTTEDDLTAAFEKAGTVGDVTIISDDSGRSRGFAFVTMFDEEGGKNALDLDGSEVSGRKISVRPPNN